MEKLELLLYYKIDVILENYEQAVFMSIAGLYSTVQYYVSSSSQFFSTLIG